MSQELTIKALKLAATVFAEQTSTGTFPDLYGVTDGKAIGTQIEKNFKDFLSLSYHFDQGNSAHGIDLPSVNTDIKTTSIKQPQSSSPFRSATQKIYGLGYNLLVFVYDKKDNEETQEATLDILHAIFICDKRTSDYTMTKSIREIINESGSDEVKIESIDALLEDKNIPLDEVSRRELAVRLVNDPPAQGVLTISNALQWRLQYSRAITQADACGYPGEVIELAE